MFCFCSFFLFLFSFWALGSIRRAFFFFFGTCPGGLSGHILFIWDSVGQSDDDLPTWGA